MAEIKYLDSPKMDEIQAINLITKHFPIAVQAYIETTQEKKFLNIWEKLGELEMGQNKLSSDEHSTSTIKQNIQRGNTRYEQAPPRNNQIQRNNNYYGQTQRNNQPRTSTNRYEQINKAHNTPMGRQMTQPTQTFKRQQQQFEQRAVKQISIHDENQDQENEVNMEDEEDENTKNWEQGVAEGDQLLL